MIEANKTMVFDMVQQIAELAYNDTLTDEQVVDQINDNCHGAVISTSDLSTLEDAATIMHRMFAGLCEHNNN